jgi:hypothetical protein
VIAATVVWVTSTAYFLTHEIPIAYYLVPGTFATALLISFASLTIDSKSVEFNENKSKAGRRTRWLFLIVALLPGLVGFWNARSNRLISAVLKEGGWYQLAVPEELSDPRAWVFSDGLSGSLWYYAGKPAYKIGWTDASSRLVAYRLAFERDEPQYLIADRDDIKFLVDEVSQLGGTMEQRGVIDSHPYYRIHWSSGGPSAPR